MSITAAAAVSSLEGGGKEKEKEKDHTGSEQAHAQQQRELSNTPFELLMQQIHASLGGTGAGGDGQPLTAEGCMSPLEKKVEAIKYNTNS